MLTLRGLTLTAAAPRIIVPLFAGSLDALRPLAAAAQADPAAELVELRLDPLPAADHTAALALEMYLAGARDGGRVYHAFVTGELPGREIQARKGEDACDPND